MTRKRATGFDVQAWSKETFEALESGDTLESTGHWPTWQELKKTEGGVQWSYTLYWRKAAGLIECVGVKLEPNHQPHPPGRTPSRLTSTVLRSFPLARLIDTFRQSNATVLAVLARTRFAEVDWAERATQAGDAWTAASGPRRGRPSKGADFYRDVARIYAEAQNIGQSPILAIRQWHRRATGAAELPNRSTAAKWVYIARHSYKFIEPREEDQE